MHTTRKSNNAFYLLLGGQTLSLLGTSMTRFALLIWAYEQNSSATTVALLGFFICITYVIASPFAGVLADRWDRRRVMFLADLCAGFTTVGMLVLFTAGELRIGHLYLAQGLAGIFEAFQEPAFGASVSLLVPKKGYTRANAMLGLGKSASRILAPAMAGFLLTRGSLSMVMVVDLFTMCLAMIGLCFIRVPDAPVSEEGREITGGSLWREIRFGIGYILKRPALSGLTGTFFLVNLFGTITYFAVHAPMILSRTGNNEMALGTVRMVMGFGGVAGGLLLTLWGGPRRKAAFYLWNITISFGICDLWTALSCSTTGWALAGFFSEFALPFLISPYFALWQEIVAPDIQGKVFSAREMVQMAAQPVGYLLGGLLADQVFEPALQAGGSLAGSFGRLVGTGAGAGMSFMFLCTCILGSMTGIIGLLLPAIRGLDRVERVHIEEQAG